MSVKPVQDSAIPDFFVGVDAVSDNVEDIKNLVNEVKSYTNLFVIGSIGITFNVMKLEDVCQYVYESGLYFIVFTIPTTDFPQSQWIFDARQRWGNRFLGLYAYDETGGRQIDNDHPYMLVEQADNCADAATKYVEQLNGVLRHYTDYYLHVGDFPLFISDYALFWFDYEAGYDVVLAQLGWNNSRPLNVALCRGAATRFNKDWGVMITWTYDSPPYIESGEELYADLILAYQSGAKYAIVFNYPRLSTYGILKEEHLDALKKLWDYMNSNPRRVDLPNSRFVYVLPMDYGYGFRGPADKIWGLWEADELSDKIWNDVNALLRKNELQLDVGYEDGLGSNAKTYRKIIFWNGTILEKHEIM